MSRHAVKAATQYSFVIESRKNASSALSLVLLIVSLHFHLERMNQRVLSEKPIAKKG